MYRPSQRAKNRRICFDVDRAFCISLSERDDRRKLFLETVGSLISNPIDFFITERCDDPVRGCYESHQAIARQVLDQGWERVLVFEDDVQPYGIRFTQGCSISRPRSMQAHLRKSVAYQWRCLYLLDRRADGSYKWKYDPEALRYLDK
ncbi:hypothetical protein A979_12045 [Pseudomonas syringae BRIP34876]|nr:hypothetical protein A979_12045 [Pseudomonas syringae BRIP34876]ELQ06848.1 hypothetical protein A987_01146 [Pseudomonas syringae BRIP34881]